MLSNMRMWSIQMTLLNIKLYNTNIAHIVSTKSHVIAFEKSCVIVFKKSCDIFCKVKNFRRKSIFRSQKILRCQNFSDVKKFSEKKIRGQQIPEVFFQIKKKIEVKNF